MEHWPVLNVEDRANQLQPLNKTEARKYTSYSSSILYWAQMMLAEEIIACLFLFRLQFEPVHSAPTLHCLHVAWAHGVRYKTQDRCILSKLCLKNATTKHKDLLMDNNPIVHRCPLCPRCWSFMERHSALSLRIQIPLFENKCIVPELMSWP